MDKLKSVRLMGTTNGDGAATAASKLALAGKLFAVDWVDGDLSDGVGAVLTCVGEDNTKTLLTLTAANADATYYPRVQACDASAGAVAGVYELPLIVGYLSLAITSGGAAHTGGAVVYYLEQ